MWESHIRFCIALLLLAVPIAIADFMLLGRRSGGWISLDFRGILIGAYLIFLVIHLALSTAAVKWFPQQGIWSLHGISAAAAVILFSVGTTVVFRLQKNKDRANYERTLAERAKLVNVLTLDSWSYSPGMDSASEIIISVTVSESGRFACGAHGWGEGEYGEMYFHSDQVEQRQVQKGEHFEHVLPLKWIKQEVPHKVEITLHLFKDSTGSAGANVTKVFTPNPSRDDDGQFFYSVLPPPVAPRQ